MKATIIIIILILAMSLTAEPELDERTPIHFIGGVVAYSGIYITTSTLLENIYWNTNSPEFIQTLETISFYVTITGLTIYEYKSNNWKGLKFYDYTATILGMAFAREVIWKDTTPVIIYGEIKQNEVGLNFCFNF